MKPFDDKQGSYGRQWDGILLTSMKIALIIGVFVLLLGVGGYGISTHNHLVAEHEAVSGKWAQVESQYQRRFDLIPNLIESVKGSMRQETAVFGAIADARTRYAGAQTIGEKAEAANQLDGALSRLLIVMEQYPQLKSIDVVTSLMSQLEGTENRIAVERQRFNEEVRVYNTQIKTFPTSLVAKMSGFTPIEYTKAQSGAEIAPKVSL